MLLAIDIGNSSVSLGVFRGEALLLRRKLSAARSGAPTSTPPPSIPSWPWAGWTAGRSTGVSSPRWSPA